MNFVRGGLAAVLVSIAAVGGCKKQDAERPPLEEQMANTSLAVSSGTEAIAEIVVRANRIERVDYVTDNQEQRAAFQKTLDALTTKAERDGLDTTWSRRNGDVHATYGATPKPGQPWFPYALLDHLERADLHVRVTDP